MSERSQTAFGLPRPPKCCPCGSYEHTVPMHAGGKAFYVDLCIADIVAALNAASIHTGASCCGHGKKPGSIYLVDGRELLVAPAEQNMGKVVAELCRG